MRLGGALICYLDTQPAIWLAEGNTRMLPYNALSCIEASEVRISPIVVLELEYLYETERTLLSPQQIVYKLNAELGSRVCDYPFTIIAEIALGETWTKDPFDRLIVSHAKANDLAVLVTSDQTIAQHYQNAIW